MPTISTISSKDIFEALNLLLDLELPSPRLSLSLLIITAHTCCVSTMCSLTAPKEKRQGIH
ncbi:hypothetical protein AB205_0016260 [Aquarana catesbeiana]|uniref:Uncharacterized protein n=1 Tax=Aquarana catesbeiana TaxID=8400 RepID=A0A2G9QFP7_AQUCT|nr:hypothetical protein AB205_0016260 [Aquarana catesbeiana]